MSLLRRTGTGRNNIAWGGGTTTSGNYLRRTSSGRNNISFINISASGTWNILNRTSSGRNDISWKNTTFSFGPDLTKYPLYTNTNSYISVEYQMIWEASYFVYYYKIGKINRNGYTNIAKVHSGSSVRTSNLMNMYFKDTSTDMSTIIYQYSKVTITGTNSDGKNYSYTCNLDESNGISLEYRSRTNYSYLMLGGWSKYSITGNNQQDLLSMTFS